MAHKRTILINGLIVTEHEVLVDYCLEINDEIIVRIEPFVASMTIDSDVDLIDCKGCYILPGLIDIHSDMIENIIVPRKGVVFPTFVALHEADRQLIQHGITTIYHSISIANSTICNKKRTLSVEKMVSIGDAIHQEDEQLMIHHRFHARLESNTIEAFDAVILRMKQGIIHELSLMDHTPGQGQYASLDNFIKEIIKQYGEVSEQRIKEIICECQNKPV